MIYFLVFNEYMNKVRVGYYGGTVFGIICIMFFTCYCDVFGDLKEYLQVKID